MKIIEVGSKNIGEIGESFLQQRALYGYISPNAFVYYKNGVKYFLEVWTRLSEHIHKTKILTVDEVTDEIKSYLIKKKFTI